MESLSDELIRRIPQKIILVEPKIGFRVKVVFFIVGVIFFLVGVVFLNIFDVHLNVSLLLMLVPLFAYFTLIFFIEKIYYEICYAFNFLPTMEYIPADRQIIIKDKKGIENLFHPEAQKIIHLDAIKAVEAFPVTNGKWGIRLLLKKNDFIQIQSVQQESKEQVWATVVKIKAMLGLNSN